MSEKGSSPRDFLSQLTLDALYGGYMDAIKKSVENREVEQQNNGIENMMLTHLGRHYPGINEYIEFIANAGETQGIGREYITAMVSGAVIMAWSITLEAESQSLPPLY